MTMGVWEIGMGVSGLWFTQVLVQILWDCGGIIELNNVFIYYMNPLEFEKYVKDMSLNSGFTKLMEKLLHSSKNELRDTPVVYLGEGKNGKVFRIGENTTIKLMKNINLHCEINNEYVK